MDGQIQAAMKKLLAEGEGPAATLYRSCMKKVTSTQSSEILDPWLDLVETVVDNATFVDAVGVINNADMVRLCLGACCFVCIHPCTSMQTHYGFVAVHLVRSASTSMPIW